MQAVKICSLYGAGFYYIPGTDTCLKIGGWVRQYLDVNANGNLTNGNLGSGNLNTRASNNGWNWKARGYITADARTQIEFGTLRSYIAVGGSTQSQSGNSSFNSNRAFIQLAGFTFGVAQSFYDLYAAPAYSYFGGMINPSSDTGDGGQTVSAYTAQFGNGLSATLPLEAPRTTNVIGDTATFKTDASVTSSGAVRYPDVVANLRMDASWGAAQIMGGIHDVAPMYYTAPTTSLIGPSHETGYFSGVGFKINTPMFGPSDNITGQFNYTVGASGYAIDGATNGATVASGGAGGFYSNVTSNSYGFGVISDGAYLAGGSVELTTMWGVGGAYEHHWNRQWQTSLYGSYIKTSYSTGGNNAVCFTQGLTVAGVAVAGCDNDWSYWNIGSRTQFNVDSQTYIGLDVIYTALNTANGGLTMNAATYGRPAA